MRGVLQRPSPVSLSPSVFNATATTEISTLSLHDALPISVNSPMIGAPARYRSPTASSTLWRTNSSRKRRPSSFRILNEDGLRFRSEEHTSELQSRENLVCRLLLEKKKKATQTLPVPDAIP